MKAGELKALNRLQCVTGGQKPHDKSEWTVQTGKQGMYYLHKSSGPAFQTFGAAKVALGAFAHNCTAKKDVIDEDDAKEEVLSIASGLDQVVAQLHKQLDMLKQYKEAAEADQTQGLQLQQPKIVDMWDVCSYVQVDKDSMMLQQKDTLLQRSTKLRCQLLLATCAVFAQKLLHNSSPVLAAHDIQAASAEEGPPLEDDFIAVESPELLKLTCKVKKVSEALDLVPLYHKRSRQLWQTD